MIVPGRGCKDDGERHLHNYESQFDPEGDTKTPVLAVVDAQPLIFCAKKDRGDDVSAEEKQKKPIMKTRVVVRVEEG